MLRYFALLLLGVALSSWGSSANAATTSVDDIDIHWISEGEGTTVVFVHGAFVDMSTWMWGDHFRELAKDFQVVALDLPGHGQSEWPADNQISIDLFARAVDAVRAETGAEKVVLVGHSMGSSVLRKYWLTFPQHVAALVTVDAPWDPRLSNTEAPLPQCSSAESMAERTECRLRSYLLPDTPVAVRDWTEEIAIPRMREVVERSVGNPLFDPSLRAETIVNVPILEVYGADRVSRGIDLDALRASAPEMLPNATYATIPRTGHFLLMERPDEFYQILEEFLRDIN